MHLNFCFFLWYHSQISNWKCHRSESETSYQIHLVPITRCCTFSLWDINFSQCFISYCEKSCLFQRKQLQLPAFSCYTHEERMAPYLHKLMMVSSQAVIYHEVNFCLQITVLVHVIFKPQRCHFQSKQPLYFLIYNKSQPYPITGTPDNWTLVIFFEKDNLWRILALQLLFMVMDSQSGDPEIPSTKTWTSVMPLEKRNVLLCWVLPKNWSHLTCSSAETP